MLMQMRTLVHTIFIALFFLRNVFIIRHQNLYEHTSSVFEQFFNDRNFKVFFFLMIQHFEFKKRWSGTDTVTVVVGTVWYYFIILCLKAMINHCSIKKYDSEQRSLTIPQLISKHLFYSYKKICTLKKTFDLYLMDITRDTPINTNHPVIFVL